MTGPATVAVILVLILLNGLFSLAEFAVVSARRIRLQRLADNGDTRAAAALGLIDEPTQFLSTVQVGITLIGILAGAYAGTTLGEDLGAFLEGYPLVAPYSEALGIGIVAIAVTYLTLVFGELVPKRIALGNADYLATLVAKPMRFLSIATAPLVFVISRSTDAVVRILRIRTKSGPSVTEDEIRSMLEAGTEAGVIGRSELSMVRGVFSLDERPVESLMTHRSDLVALDLDEPALHNIRKMVQSGLSDFPAYRGSPDTVIGIVSVKDVLALLADGGTPDLGAMVKKPLFVAETMTVLKLLESFQRTGLHTALVTDEYGNLQGIVSMHDVMAEIVGGGRASGVADAPVVVREDGSWLIRGDTPVADLKGVLPVPSFPAEGERKYLTLAGLILFLLQRMPRTGDHVTAGGLRYEVVDMDGNRIDRLLVTRAGNGPDDTGPGDAGRDTAGSGAGTRADSG